MKFLGCVFAMGVIAAACSNNAANDKNITQDKNDNTKKETSEVKKQSSNTSTKDAFEIKARFNNFTLGDVEHYEFTDAEGHEWDFRSIEDKTYEFAVELPKNKSNDENQGWGSNKSLQGKWFNIKYVNREMPEHEDGPMVKLPVVVEIKMVQ